MPCDTITTQTLSTSLTKASCKLVVTTLESLGFTIRSATETSVEAQSVDRYETVSWTFGKGLTIRTRSTDPEATGKKIQQAYSRAAVSWAAQRAGWTVKETGTNKLQVTRG